VRNLLFVSIIGALAFTSQAAHAETRPLSGKEIRALFPGSFAGTWEGQHSVTITASQNGTISGRAMLASDTGVWSVVGQKLCVSFRSWTKNARHCGEVYKQGSSYIGFIKNGRPMLQFRKLIESAQNQP